VNFPEGNTESYAHAEVILSQRRTALVRNGILTQMLQVLPCSAGLPGTSCICSSVAPASSPAAV